MKGIISIPSQTIREISEQTEIPVWFGYAPLHIDVLIRWGSTALADAGVVINPAKAIRLAADKARCRELLREQEIPVPNVSSGTFPCIGRRAKHSQGRGFWYCNNQEELEEAKKKGAVYFSEFYPKTNEYRVHIGGGKVIFYSIKEGDKSQHVWNHKKSGFVFRNLRRSEWRPEIYRLAKKAIKAVGLDFGAVDIMADPTDPNLPVAVVTEINTAPSLSPYGLRKYSEYFNAIVVQ